jgi:hypothetical protein
MCWPIQYHRREYPTTRPRENGPERARERLAGDALYMITSWAHGRREVPRVKKQKSGHGASRNTVLTLAPPLPLPKVLVSRRQSRTSMSPVSSDGKGFLTKSGEKKGLDLLMRCALGQSGLEHTKSCFRSIREDDHEGTMIRKWRVAMIGSRAAKLGWKPFEREGICKWPWHRTPT